MNAVRKDGRLDFPVDALPRSGETIYGNGAHSAAGRLMSDHARVERAGFDRGESKEQVDLAFGDGLRPVHALIADDEIAFMRRAAGERAIPIQRIQERIHLSLRAFPDLR
jgi:hypothetical protein